MTTESAAPRTPPAPPATNRAYLHFLQAAYDLVYLLFVLIALPVIALMMIFRPRWRAGLLQRLGFVPPRTGDRPTLWIHGVSNGEVLAAQELVALIDEEMPWVDVVISTTTRTGQHAAQRTYPDKTIFYYPLDFSFATRRVVERIRPDLVLLMELELWPNFLLTTSLRDLPVLLANGRMSTKSAQQYKRLQRLIPEPMTRVLHYCVQSEEYAERFRFLGVPPDRLTITGSMKFDAVADDLPEGVVSDYRRRLAVAPDAFVLLGGSTHGHEERVLLDAYARIRVTDPGCRLVLVPRHPKHLKEVESVVRARGLVPVPLSSLESRWPDDIDVGDAVVVGDTAGELARLYSLADLVYVGGTLTDRGGQNMMEPAGLGKAVVVGPNTWNFRDPMDLLLSRDGIRQMSDEEGVCDELVRLHAHPGERRRLGGNAQRICVESKGATRRILDILTAYVPKPTSADRPETGESS